MKRDKTVYIFWLMSTIAQYFILSDSGNGAYLRGVKQTMATKQVGVTYFIPFCIPIVLALIAFMDQLDFYLNNYGRFQMTRRVSFVSIVGSIEGRILKIVLGVLLLQYVFNRCFSENTFLLLISYTLIHLVLIHLMLIMSLVMPVSIAIAILSFVHLMSYYGAYYNRFPWLLWMGKFIHGEMYIKQVTTTHFVIVDIMLPMLIIGFCFIVLTYVSAHKDYF